MPSLSKIGGADDGKLLTLEENKTLDGFEDYTLYIKLMMAELKILLIPIFLSLKLS